MAVGIFIMNFCLRVDFNLATSNGSSLTHVKLTAYISIIKELEKNFSSKINYPHQKIKSSKKYIKTSITKSHTKIILLITILKSLFKYYRKKTK